MARKNDFTSGIDAHVGRKVHELRLASGLSRQQVADKIDVTHQQLQKYENGSNRISAGRLAAIAKVFKQPIEYFFEGNYMEIPEHHQRMALEVSRNFMKIKNINHQQAVHDMIRKLSLT